MEQKHKSWAHLICVKQEPNNAINTDGNEQWSFVAPLIAAGYGGRRADTWPTNARTTLLQPPGD